MFKSSHLQVLELVDSNQLSLIVYYQLLVRHVSMYSTGAHSVLKHKLISKKSQI